MFAEDFFGHARGVLSRSALQLARQGTHATLDFVPFWPETHPRTLYLLRELAEAFSRGGPLRLALRT